MIYFATIHYRDDRWIELQTRMLKRFVETPFQTVSYVTGVPAEAHESFDHVITEGDPPHAVKLNQLADRVINLSKSDDDWLIFIDGDAFPIAPLVPVLKRYFTKYPLAAVQRLENLGEQHTHPCFTATTVGFWKNIGGDWGQGYQWVNALGNQDTDVGSNLYGKLKENHITWKALHRSNAVNLHPVFFGVYGDLIYHHGAGFRSKECRQVFYNEGVFAARRSFYSKIMRRLPSQLVKHLPLFMQGPEMRLVARLDRRKERLDADVFNQLQNTPEFIQSLLTPVQSDALQ